MVRPRRWSDPKWNDGCSLFSSNPSDARLAFALQVVRINVLDNGALSTLLPDSVIHVTPLTALIFAGSTATRCFRLPFDLSFYKRGAPTGPLPTPRGRSRADGNH